MTMEMMTFVGTMLAVFGAGVAVGKLTERIERLLRKSENEEHNVHNNKNDRR